MNKIIYIFIIIISLVACADSNESTKIDIAKAMSGSQGDYKKANEVREFIFPQDHGAHNEFALEWWYFTGNLQTKEGRRFGYQFTIFRNALTDKLDTNINSSWNTNQLYFANFAVTDVEGNEFYFDEKFSRELNGMTGASYNPLKVSIEDWQISGNYDNNNYSLPRLRIKAESDEFGIDFTLYPQKKIVLHGKQGLSYKSNDTTNASYYYSLTRIETQGEIRIKDEEFSINGNSWMDREWSTSALSNNQVGWDWFSIQFDDSTEMMFFRLRDKNNNADFAKGTLIDKNGNSEYIVGDSILLKPLDFVKLDSGVEYPIKWSIFYPAKNLEIELYALVKDQELDLSAVRYWEGAMKVSGTKEGNPVGGYGYVELTGYDGKFSR